MSVNILNKKDCTGCGLCGFICPLKAIEMIENKEGFTEPKVLKECIECGLCEKKCPQLCKLSLHKPIDVKQSLIITDDYKKSSSGGVVFEIAKEFIKNNGIFYGALFNTETLTVEHRRISSLEELVKTQGSFYVQSLFYPIFSQIKNDLEQNKKVLCIGSPCQIGGLKVQFGNNDNFFSIDFVCHGVPSPGFLRKHLNYISKGKKITKLRFRRKSWNSINRFALVVNNKIISYKADVYYNCFIENKSFREVCYNCYYATKKRVGDLSVGDAVVDVFNKDFYPYNCKTLLTINSEKGKSLINEKTIKSRDIDYLKEVNLNQCLLKPEKRPEERISIYEDLNNMEYSLFIKKYQKNSTINERFKNNLELLIPYKFKRKIRMIIKNVK